MKLKTTFKVGSITIAIVTKGDGSHYQSDRLKTSHLKTAAGIYNKLLESHYYTEIKEVRG